MSNLIVILDPRFGDRLESLSQGAPIWIVASPENKEACHSLWANHPRTDHRDRGAVTHYDVSNLEDRAGNLLDIIPQLETHHGEVKGNEITFPDGFLLEVVGLPLTEVVADGLREVGFSSFVNTNEGFQAKQGLPALT